MAPSAIHILLSLSGQMSYGSAKATGILYSTILPVAGSSLPILPLLNTPYQTMPFLSTLPRRIRQNGSSW